MKFILQPDHTGGQGKVYLRDAAGNIVRYKVGDEVVMPRALWEASSIKHRLAPKTVAIAASDEDDIPVAIAEPTVTSGPPKVVKAATGSEPVEPAELDELAEPTIVEPNAPAAPAAPAAPTSLGRPVTDSNVALIAAGQYEFIHDTEPSVLLEMISAMNDTAELGKMRAVEMGPKGAKRVQVKVAIDKRRAQLNMAKARAKNSKLGGKK